MLSISILQVHPYTQGTVFLSLRSSHSPLPLKPAEDQWGWQVHFALLCNSFIVLLFVLSFILSFLSHFREQMSSYSLQRSPCHGGDGGKPTAGPLRGTEGSDISFVVKLYQGRCWGGVCDA